MDGRGHLAQLLKDLRGNLGITQRELAGVAGVPQPTIAQIEAAQREPSLTLFSKIVESVGFDLEIVVRATPSSSLVAVARRIARNFRQANDVGRARDTALREILDIRTTLQRVAELDFERLTEVTPTTTGYPEWDAILAAVVEEIASDRGYTVPKWCEDEDRFIPGEWHLTENQLLFEEEQATTPIAYRRRGLSISLQALASV